MQELRQLMSQTADSLELMGFAKTRTWCLWSPQIGVSWDCLC